MERIIKERGPGPWFYGLYATTVSEIYLRPRPEVRLRAATRPPKPTKPEELRFHW